MILKHALKGINFPKSKNEIVSYAQQHNANNEIISDLQQLPDRTYNNTVDVAQEFSGKRFGGDSK